MMKRVNPTDDDLSFEQVKSILVRATNIETEMGNSLSLTELRKIAAEAGISPVALERAIKDELRPLQDRVGSVPPLRQRKWVFIGLGAGSIVGGMSSLVLAGDLVFLGVIAGVGGVLMTAGVIAGLIRERRVRLEFQLANAGLWASYALTAVLTSGADGAWFVLDVAAISLVGMLSSGLVGGLIIHNRRDSELAVSSDDSGFDGGSGRFGRIVALGKRLGSAGTQLWRTLNRPLTRATVTTRGSHAG